MLHGVSWCYTFLQGVTMVVRCFMVLHCVTCNMLGYRVLHGATGFYTVLHAVTGC